MTVNKVIIAKENLGRALGIVTRAAAGPKSTLPILANVKIEVGNDGVCLSTTNLEIGIIERIPAMETPDEPWTTTIPARTFNDLAGTLPDEPVSLELNPKTQTVKLLCGTVKTNLKGIDAKGFPPMPKPDGKNRLCVRGDALKAAVKQVAFCASGDGARPVLTGVFLHGEKDTRHLSMQAADGFRLGLVTVLLDEPLKAPFKALVPAKAMNELIKLMNGDEVMDVSHNYSSVVFHTECFDLASQLIEGNYPDLEQVVPTSHTTRTVMNKALFLNAVKQAEIFAREGSNICRLEIVPVLDDLSQPRIVVAGQAEETGHHESEVPAVVEGEGQIIAFNCRFLKELLDAIPTVEVALETTVDTSPGLFRPVGGDGAGGLRLVVMPMSLGR